MEQENKFLKEKFEILQNHESKPREEAWDRIQMKLNNKETNRKQTYFNFAIAASLVAIITIMFTWIVLDNQQKELPQTANEITTQKDTILENKTENATIETETLEKKEKNP